MGVVALGLGMAYLLVEVYRNYVLPPEAYYVTLQFIPRPVRAALFVALGLGAILVALFKLGDSLLSALMPAERGRVVDMLYHRRRRARGPRIVAIGGGHGLSTLLRGLKEFTDNITAVVTVADDGGSSGRLRQDLGILPPGDFRNCIAALADDEALLTKLFQYRFGQGAGLDGHSLGNLLITALTDITGSFEKALTESSKVLAVQGRILPSTLHNVILCAEVRSNGAILKVEGESRITKTGGLVERVFLKPEDVPAYPDAVRAILEADVIVIGPGSLYTSVMPNLLVRDILRAIRASRAVKIYVCNIATQRGETQGFTLQDHVEALERHVGSGVFEVVIANNNLGFKTSDVEPVPPQWERDDYLVIKSDLVDKASPWRHNPRKLARLILQVYELGTRLVPAQERRRVLVWD